MDPRILTEGEHRRALRITRLAQQFLLLQLMVLSVTIRRMFLIPLTDEPGNPRMPRDAWRLLQEHLARLHNTTYARGKRCAQQSGE